MSNEIKDLLIQIGTLLERFNEDSWSNAFKRLVIEYQEQPTETRGRIISLYGGMGSFNDIVLYHQGNVVQSENDELDRMRSRLYQLCRQSNHPTSYPEHEIR